MSYIDDYLRDINTISDQLDRAKIDAAIDLLFDVRENRGRVFFLGVGGSAAYCSHAVADFRKTGGFQAYTPVDNIAELTARTNDEGWDTVFLEWLKVSCLNEKDAVFVFSVGGGDKRNNVSPNLVSALEFARSTKAKIIGIVGRDGGFTAQVADVAVIIPPINEKSLTPLTESFHAILWHLIVSDPRLKKAQNKWESIAKGPGI